MMCSQMKRSDGCRVSCLMVAVSALWLAMVSQAKAEETVEVLHWWTSGGEASALEVLKNELETQGVQWVDSPIAGGSGEAAMTTLRARVTAGDPPTSAQMLGFTVTQWADLGVLANLDEVATPNRWDEVIPLALQKFSKYQGHWVAAPVNVHSTNWMWVNKAALDRSGLPVPTSWSALIALLNQFRDQGIIPIAHGGQAWQDATVFDAVVLSLGNDFYQSALIDLDPEALGSSQMKEAFERMRVLRSYVDENFSGRDWNLATAMVIDGRAGLQFMGDWAKGEFLGAGKVPGVDFVCSRYPGTQGSVTFNADQFAMFELSDPEARRAQLKMANAVESPGFQSAFNVVKGSVPARTDVSDEAFDACGKKGMADLREASQAGTLYGSMGHGHAVPPNVQNAIYDVVTRQFNGELTPSEAVEELVVAVEVAQ